MKNKLNTIVSIIILGSNPATKLGLIRSIGEAMECRITVVNMVHQMPKRNRIPSDCRSKYVTRHLYALKYQPEVLCETLLTHCKEDGVKSIILSVDDDSAHMIDVIQDRLKPYFICANINGKAGEIAKLMNKQVQKQLAMEHGFNVTKSWTVEIKEGRFSVPDDVTYPCYVKGLLSYYTLKDFQGKCESKEALCNALENVAQKYSCKMIVEEFLDIDADLGLIGFCDGKRCVIPGIVELLDEGHGPHKGVSAFGLVRKTKQNEDYVEKTASLVSSLGLFGLFNIDLVKSHGKIYFIELNLRFAAYGYAVSRAGVNLPEYFVRAALGQDTSAMNGAIDKDSYYLNERVGLDDVIGGFRSLEGFKSLKQKADFGLMENEADPEPYRNYKKQVVESYIKAKIKKIIKR